MPSTILSDNGVSSGSAGLKTTASNDGILVLQTTTSGGTATNAIYVDNLQNVGLTAAPSAWGGVSTGRVFQTGGAAFYGRTDTPDAYMATNTYRDSSNTFRYQTTAAASFTQLSGNSLYLYSADSGTAGNAITFTQTLQVGKGLSLALQGATSQAGTGITFPATQSASSNANTLDDYEEGTFTPTVSAVGGIVGLGYSNQVGNYIKIGTLVYAFVDLTWASSSSSGATQLNGLPFTAQGESYNTFAYRAYSALALTTSLLPAGYVSPASTSFIFQYIDQNTGVETGASFRNSGGRVNGWVIYRATA